MLAYIKFYITEIKDTLRANMDSLRLHVDQDMKSVQGDVQLSVQSHSVHMELGPALGHGAGHGLGQLGQGFGPRLSCSTWGGRPRPGLPRGSYSNEMEWHAQTQVCLLALK